MSELYNDPTDDPVPLSEQGALNTVVVITNFPDAESAGRIASELVAVRLAACANLMAPCTSVFRWHDKLTRETEVPVWLKTTSGGAATLIEELERLHPYDVPEVLVVNPCDVSVAYTSWVAESVTRR